ncbi:FAD-dependent oxidoreductase [Actinoplanes sp. NPDC051411]|uniref:NAD(P)/FAD-dependent oxidoreductase n=1 Tax=Actinoplanes sp. NPDC051411 TaxID=3155522 RepID=UPI00342AA725
MTDVLVVGAAAGGIATAEALRRRGFTGPITILGAEPHLPYDRPPLSKQVLAGEWEPERARLRPVDATLYPDDPAVAFDAASHRVTTAAGRIFQADSVVLATGAHPRRLPGALDAYALRSLDDALSLRAALVGGRRLVVVGDGVLGTEIAATAAKLGADVTLAGPQPAPMRLQLGPVVSGLLAGLHTRGGVRLRLGSGVTGCAPAGVAGLDGPPPAGAVPDAGPAGPPAFAVTLASGELLPADVVVVAFGAAPATDWLAGSGLTVDDGVVCDEQCRAADGVWAVGDVARWWHAGLGASVRLENRTNAVEQADAVAANILGAARAYTPVPYFWTEQFDARIHVYGVPGPEAEFDVVEGDPAAGRFVGVYHRAGRPVGVLGWNMPKQARLRKSVLSFDKSVLSFEEGKNDDDLSDDQGGGLPVRSAARAG